MSDDRTFTIDLTGYDPDGTAESPISPNPYPNYKIKLDAGDSLDATVNGSQGNAKLTYAFSNLPAGVASAWVTQFVYREKGTTGPWIFAGPNAGSGAEFWYKTDTANSVPGSNVIQWVKDKADDGKPYEYVLYVDLRDSNDQVVDTFVIDPEIDNEGPS
jgi:hypothetical protein